MPKLQEEIDFDARMDRKELEDKVKLMAESIYVERVRMFRNCKHEKMLEAMEEARQDAISLANYYYLSNSAKGTEK